MNLKHSEEITKAQKAAIQILKENGIDLKRDSWTVVQPFSNGQAITVELDDVFEGERSLNVAISDTTFILEPKEGTLDIFGTEDEDK